ncbi:hypothetical protein BKA82DRAFT_1007912 [Pisolithus tinctorius]|uniref:Uncharacterized protein n=1 Tax=Pisolithus tinctorius Marx 270 TaxID=870435 RepID=A0A0C3ICZ4_PISTI|nr:hypothetical protein BKA82DRAFT_1007912 [Pisolithus tinctorius]KIN94902.1 hypothetical protein M404DRAFT_1007912 [Pisolithus tinctorius Marx 270]
MSNPISVRLNLLLHHSRPPPVLSRLPGAQPDPNLSVPASSLWIPPPRPASPYDARRSSRLS